MKKLLLATLCFLITFSAFTMSAKKYHSSVEAAWNQNIYTDGSAYCDAGMEFGYKGIYTLKESPSSFFASFGLLASFNRAMSRDPSDYENPGGSAKLYPWSLYVPVQFGYNWACSSKVALSASGGFYIREGLFGRAKDVKSWMDSDGVIREKEFNASNLYTAGLLKRFDIGWVIEADVTLFKHFRIFLRYTNSFNDLKAHDKSFIGGYRRVRAIGVGYNF